MDKLSIADIRRQYGSVGLIESSVLASPFEQFHLWFQDILQTENPDPTAMVLSTVDEQGYPDSRIVLLKEYLENELVFFSNYQSAKAMQLARHPQAAVNFYWPELSRQIRIRGVVSKLDAARSDQYFASRPKANQISAIASPQSQAISSREWLENRIHDLEERYKNQDLTRPDTWGGYSFKPSAFEFWQGRDNRVHDRIYYFYQDGLWQLRRLAP